ncbi:MAG: hypothetical protein HKN39_04925 [Flavobacteriales bacterium]|nr:hypothetical protein [Flavobacteriales bacterium]
MITDPNLPKFLVVGTAKAGTTSLYHYLSQHPKLNIPVKETFYFIRDHYPSNLLDYPKQRRPESIVRSLSDYQEIYSTAKGRTSGEIGTGYLHHYETAIPEIKKTLGEDVKIIIILRDPIERTYSGYLHFKKFSIEMDGLIQEIKMENSRKAEGYDFMWQFSGLSYYYESVKAYMGSFNNVSIFFYEDLKKDPKKFLNDVLRSIGVEVSVDIDVAKSFNPSGDPKSGALQKMITGDHWFKRSMRPVYHFLLGKEKARSIRDRMRDSNIQKHDMDPENRAVLKELFSDDVLKLRSLLRKDVNKINELWL